MAGTTHSASLHAIALSAVPVTLLVAAVAFAQPDQTAPRVLRGHLYVDEGLTEPLPGGSLVAAYADNNLHRRVGFGYLMGTDGSYELKLRSGEETPRVWMLESDYRCHRSFHFRDVHLVDERHSLPVIPECRAEHPPEIVVRPARGILSETAVLARLGNRTAAEQLRTVRSNLDDPALVEALRRPASGRNDLPPAREAALQEFLTSGPELRNR